jgi:hypothetical protein
MKPPRRSCGVRLELSGQGPNAELVARHGSELVMIADEGACQYRDSPLLKIGENGSRVQISTT